MQHNKAIILFDGICNLCNQTVDFLLKYDRKKQFRFVALQSDEGKMLIRNFQIPDDTDSVILIRQNRLYLESDAIIEIAKKLNYPWKLGITGKLIPKKIRDRLYRFISKNRYRWFGKRKNCRIIPL
jgi:predicted DCC family thiol-disulfide oxidoreductase YuxK